METRSLADFLRSRSDEQLLTLFAARPDLITPVPSDIASLAVRASSAPSIARAVDGLNRWQYQILEACTALDEPFSEKELFALTDKAAAFVLPTLVERALIYTTDEGYRTPSSLRDVIGYEPAGLGPAAMAKLKLTKLKEAPVEAKKVLDQLMWGPPRGSVGDIKQPSAGVKWLMDEHFLVPKDQRTVLMPREVAIYLRGGKIFKELEMQPPELRCAAREKKGVQLAAIANITTVLRWVEELLNFWSQEPADALRAGGLGVRELRTVATHLGVDESCAAFVAEISYLAGLVVVDSDDRIMPTSAFDLWLAKSASEKWQALAAPWLITSRVPGLVGRSKSVAALGPELDRVSAAHIRKLTLELIKSADGAPATDSLVESARWYAPSKRTGGLQEELVLWSVQEAEWLGITGQGAISPYGIAFLNGEDEAIIDRDLPKAVDHILIQSDNTAIAPGPLLHEIAQELALIADIESRGGATVYRFSESTLRRGLDHGKTGDEILIFLKKVSKTPIPQPLEYLIADISKKHGKLRVGNTSSFIRCEDPAVIVEILNDKRLDILHIRRIAPEVLICDLEAGDAISILRGAGYLPAAENSQGLLLSGTSIQRAKIKPRPPRILGEIEAPTIETLNAALRSLHTGEKSTARQSTLRSVANPATLPRTSANETLDILIKHMTKKPKGALSIGYADNNGAVTHRIVDPLKIHAGALLARDHATGELIPFKIARITGVAEL